MAKKKPRRRKKRGPGPVIAIVLAGMVCCWMGLVKVDRQIRAVTINQSPPLWESRGEGSRLEIILLGQRMELDFSPVERMGEAVVELVETPGAPVRLMRGAWEAAERALGDETKPRPNYTWKKAFF